jgi:16S rRNA (cytidine1402-2'-O)-methyltransferase
MRPSRPQTEAAERSGRGFTVAGTRIEVRALEPGLYPVATPIGNLRDISLRALETLAGADLIACEDTRVTRRLLDHYAIATPLTLYHEHNAIQARPRLLQRLADGAAVALVSDAGTPLISDPGYKLVREVREAGSTVIPIPGASATLAALVASGLPTDRFFFEGFLPPKHGARQSRIGAIAQIPASLVLFETGPRLAETLADLAAGLGPRAAAVCRELTKLHEEIRSGDLPTLADAYAAVPAPKGEIVLVIAPPERDAPQASADEVDALLTAALERLSVKDAASEVAAATGHPRRTVYQRALSLAKGARDGAR